MIITPEREFTGAEQVFIGQQLDEIAAFADNLSVPLTRRESDNGQTLTLEPVIRKTIGEEFDTTALGFPPSGKLTTEVLEDMLPEGPNQDNYGFSIGVTPSGLQVVTSHFRLHERDLTRSRSRLVEYRQVTYAPTYQGMGIYLAEGQMHKDFPDTIYPRNKSIHEETTIGRTLEPLIPYFTGDDGQRNTIGPVKDTIKDARHVTLLRSGNNELGFR